MWLNMRSWMSFFVFNDTFWLEDVYLRKLNVTDIREMCVFVSIGSLTDCVFKSSVLPCVLV